MTFVVGLTGGIGSGKSVVAGLFARRGITVVDTDAIAHELTAPGGGAIDAIRDSFGSDFITREGISKGSMRLVGWDMTSQSRSTLMVSMQLLIFHAWFRPFWSRKRISLSPIVLGKRIRFLLFVESQIRLVTSSHSL